MAKTIGLKEIERIFEVTDALKISREALVIPLRTENPGRVEIAASGKLEIAVDAEAEFEQWLSGLKDAIDAAMASRTTG